MSNPFKDVNKAAIWIMSGVVVLGIAYLSLSRPPAICTPEEVKREMVKTAEVEKTKPPVRTAVIFTDCSGKTARLTAFVLECAKNANPMSDEEGEALVQACRDAGLTLVCTSVHKFVVKKDGFCYLEESNTLTSCNNSIWVPTILQ